MKKQYNNMIRFPDSEEPDLITVSQLLKFHQLVIDLPKAVMDAEVDACLKTADVSVYENQIIFKGEDYTVTINPNDPNKTIIKRITVFHDIIVLMGLTILILKSLNYKF